MRLFEAAAAGALIITDDFEFPREWFRDSVLYVDSELPAPLVIDQIVRHVDWAMRHRDAASRLAQQSNALFRRSLTLESMLGQLPEFVDRVRPARCMVPVARLVDRVVPGVEYIIRIGLYPTAMLTRALESLAAQTYPAIGVIVVQSQAVTGLEPVLARFRSRFASFKHVLAGDTGYLSTPLCVGLGQVTANYFAVLDDDDTLFSNHVAALMSEFEEDPKLGFVYSGHVKIEDEPGNYFAPFQFNGPAKCLIPETRDLACIEEQNFEAFRYDHNTIASNAWISRSNAIDEHLLVDPQLDHYEVVHLIATIVSGCRCRFTALATAASHWRSTSRDNWSLVQPLDDPRGFENRWLDRTQRLQLPVWNKVAPVETLYDAQKEHFGDIS